MIGLNSVSNPLLTPQCPLDANSVYSVCSCKFFCLRKFLCLGIVFVVVKLFLVVFLGAWVSEWFVHSFCAYGPGFILFSGSTKCSESETTKTVDSILWCSVSFCKTIIIVQTNPDFSIYWQCRTDTESGKATLWGGREIQ